MARVITAPEVVATFLGWDIAEVRDYRYHYGRTSSPVYAIGEKYYCALAPGKKPPQDRDGDPWNWVAQPKEVLGRVIWIA